MTIYIDWENQRIFENRDALMQKLAGIMKNYLDEFDVMTFEEYLNANYESLTEIFNFSSEEKERIEDEYRSYIYSTCFNQFLEQFEEYEIEEN